MAISSCDVSEVAYRAASRGPKSLDRGCVLFWRPGTLSQGSDTDQSLFVCGVQIPSLTRWKFMEVLSSRREGKCLFVSPLVVP